MKFTLALLLAGLFKLRRPRDAMRSFRTAWLLWRGGLKPGKKADEHLLDRRLRCCRQCPVFFTALETCGSPLVRGLHGLGCWCYMPYKAKLKDARCWIDEFCRNNDGTPDEHGWEYHCCSGAEPFRKSV